MMLSIVISLNSTYILVSTEVLGPGAGGDPAECNIATRRNWECGWRGGSRAGHYWEETGESASWMRQEKKIPLYKNSTLLLEDAV
jgi:hypothetical protein